MRDSIGTVLLSGRFATDEALSVARIGFINRSGQDPELEVLLPDADEGQAMQLHVAASARERQDSGLQVRGPR